MDGLASTKKKLWWVVYTGFNDLQKYCSSSICGSRYWFYDNDWDYDGLSILILMTSRWQEHILLHKQGDRIGTTIFGYREIRSFWWWVWTIHWMEIIYIYIDTHTIIVASQLFVLLYFFFFICCIRSEERNKKIRT
jgi:hypothetical protein